LFFSYIASVVLLSLGMYGIWCVLHDLWSWWLEPRFFKLPSCSFLVLVHNMDLEIEDLLRYLLRKVENTDLECDIVVADGSSNDLTAAILLRLEEEYPVMRVVNIPDNRRPVSEALTLCRGEIVHILDLSSRLNHKSFSIAVSTLLKKCRRACPAN
jgi:hypothetical protein